MAQGPVPQTLHRFGNVHTDTLERARLFELIQASIPFGTVTVVDTLGPERVAFGMPVEEYLAHVHTGSLNQLATAIQTMAAGMTRLAAHLAVGQFSGLIPIDMRQHAQEVVDNFLKPAAPAAGVQVAGESAAGTRQSGVVRPANLDNASGQRQSKPAKKADNLRVGKATVADRRAIALKGWATRKRNAAAAKRKTSAARKRRS